MEISRILKVVIIGILIGQILISFDLEVIFWRNMLRNECKCFIFNKTSVLLTDLLLYSTIFYGLRNYFLLISLTMGGLIVHLAMLFAVGEMYKVIIPDSEAKYENAYKMHSKFNIEGLKRRIGWLLAFNVQFIILIILYTILFGCL